MNVRPAVVVTSISIHCLDALHALPHALRRDASMYDLLS